MRDMAYFYRTYIFTFDSLGIRHPQAIKKLSAYLRMEAKSKKGVDARGLIEGKNALVNFLFSVFSGIQDSSTGTLPDKLLRLWNLSSPFRSNFHERSNEICKYNLGMAHPDLYMLYRRYCRLHE